LICGVLSGCGEPTARLNAPPQGDSANRSELQPVFIYMTDNATMSDLSIADIHFVPHTTELNSLGTARLTRIAKLIESYGGTVRYEARAAGEEFVAQRIEHVRDFLTTTGIEMDKVDVVVAHAGSGRTLATEAMESTERGMVAGQASQTSTQQQ
jgi:hypothetical protein